MADEDVQEVKDGADGSDDTESAVKKKSDVVASGSGKNSQQTLIYFVLCLNVLVLVALVAFAYTKFSKKEDSVSLSDVEATRSTEGGHAAAGAEHGGGGGEHGEGGEGGAKAEASKFLKESFTVNLADTATRHYAKVDVEIEVDDDFVRDEVTRMQPKIRDFIVIVLSSKTYEQIASVDGRDFLREEIRNKINGYLTRGQIKNVYFTQFIIQ